MTKGPLLAKSGDPSPGRTLQGHTWQVMEAARLLLEHRAAATERAVGHALPNLPRIVMLAAFLHDLGKANDVFQTMVRGQKVGQPVRHEALSLVIAKRYLWDWLSAVYTPAEIDHAAVIAAGHHRKFPVRAVAESGASLAHCTVELGHPDFAKVLQIGVIQLCLPSVPPTLLVNQRVVRCDAEDLLNEVNDAMDLLADIDLAVAKAFLLAADVLGSAEPYAIERQKFVDEVFARRATQPELATIAIKRLDGKAARPFQQAVESSTAQVTLATAGCGTGKTVAAYLWAQQHAGRQLWFCYPTTGTATEGFKDYLVDVDLETRLEHGRREVDLDILGLVDGDEDDAHKRHMARVEALWVWGAKAISCTVDTVLGLLQCQRKGMYAWPGLADAVFVFDEIHAYDARMFGGLLRLIEAMPGAPVLLMTATLPTARLDRLRTTVQRVHGRPLAEIKGPAELEQLPRYTRSDTDPGDAVRQCLAEGGKVLWVCNTVGRCQEIADGSWPVVPLRYHSRYRYCDRVQRHNEVIAAFKAKGPCLVVTTQVCEMSLDLSADLLVTDLAPIPSLVQRLGRLNRHASSGDPPKPFIVIEQDNALPYSEDQLEEARTWLRDSVFTKPGISQQDLAASWAAIGGGGDTLPDLGSNWLDGGWATEPREVREASPSLTILLESDAVLVNKKLDSAVRLAIPMNPPKTNAWMSWRREKHIVVAPRSAVTYDPLRGAQWL